MADEKEKECDVYMNDILGDAIPRCRHSSKTFVKTVLQKKLPFFKVKFVKKSEKSVIIFVF